MIYYNKYNVYKTIARHIRPYRLRDHFHCKHNETLKPDDTIFLMICCTDGRTSSSYRVATLLNKIYTYA